MGAYRVCHDGASERAFRVEDERNMYLHTFVRLLSTIRYYYCLLLAMLNAYLHTCLHILAGNIHNKCGNE